MSYRLWTTIIPTLTMSCLTGCRIGHSLDSGSGCTSFPNMCDSCSSNHDTALAQSLWYTMSDGTEALKVFEIENNNCDWLRSIFDQLDDTCNQGYPAVFLVGTNRRVVKIEYYPWLIRQSFDYDMIHINDQGGVTIGHESSGEGLPLSLPFSNDTLFNPSSRYVLVLASGGVPGDVFFRVVFQALELGYTHIVFTPI